MGKKRFAGTLSCGSHSTTANKYGGDLSAWIRGWDFGVEVRAEVIDGEDVFELYTAGGSTDGRTNNRTFIGIVNANGFVRGAR